jgi:uncharacterized membrane protein
MLTELGWLYPWLKTLHILLAIIAVGFNLSYGVLLARAAREPEHLGHVLRTVKVLDDRFANPAYGLLLLVGLAMVFIGPWEITDLWILVSLGLYLLLVVVGFAVFSPLLRQQLTTLDAHGASSPAFMALAGRARSLGIVLGVLVVVIVGLMVLKPTLA